MKKTPMEIRVRTDIKEALMKVTKANSPNLYRFFHRNNTLDVAAYNRLENRIVSRAVETGLPIESVIPQLEDELDLM